MPSPKIDTPAVIHSYTVVIFSRPRRRQPRCGCVACRGLLMVSEVPVNDSGEATSTYVPDFTYLRYLYHTHTIRSSYLIVTEVIALCAPRPTYPVPTIGNTEIFSSPSGHGTASTQAAHMPAAAVCAFRILSGLVFLLRT